MRPHPFLLRANLLRANLLPARSRIGVVLAALLTCALALPVGGVAAAAPLGTDDEAGGNPPTREQILEAARHELGPARSPHEKRVRRTIPLRAKDGVGLGLILVAVLLVVVLLALAL